MVSYPVRPLRSGFPGHIFRCTLTSRPLFTDSGKVAEHLEDKNDIEGYGEWSRASRKRALFKVALAPMQFTGDLRTYYKIPFLWKAFHTNACKWVRPFLWTETGEQGFIKQQDNQVHVFTLALTRVNWILLHERVPVRTDACSEWRWVECSEQKSISGTNAIMAMLSNAG